MAGKVNTGFYETHLNEELFNNILAKICINAKLKGWSRKDIQSNENMTGMFKKTVSKDDTARLTGLFVVHLEYTTPPHTDTIQTEEIVFKSKARSDEMCSALTNPSPDKNINDLLKEGFQIFGYTNAEYVELECVTSPRLQPILPEIYWSCLDEENGIFVYAMEYFNDAKFTHKNEMNVECWYDEDITHVLNGLAYFHAMYFGVPDAEIKKDLKHLEVRSGILHPKWKPLLEASVSHHPDLLSSSEVVLLKKICDDFLIINAAIEECPKTLIHFDIHPNNLCLRKSPRDNQKFLCLYDWETACLGPPHVDVARFLSTVLPLDTSGITWNRYIQLYLDKLKGNACTRPEVLHHLTIEGFQKMFDACMILDFLVSFTLTGVIQLRFRDTEFLNRVLKMKFQYIKSSMKRYNDNFIKQEKQ